MIDRAKYELAFDIALNALDDLEEGFSLEAEIAEVLVVALVLEPGDDVEDPGLIYSRALLEGTTRLSHVQEGILRLALRNIVSVDEISEDG